MPAMEIPEIECITSEENMRPGIPDTVMVMVIRRLDPCKHLAVGRPQRVNKGTSFKHGVDTFRRIGSCVIVLKNRFISDAYSERFFILY